MALAAINSKAVDLLLLINYRLLPLMFAGGGSLFFIAILSVISTFAFISLRKRALIVCFLRIVNSFVGLFLKVPCAGLRSMTAASAGHTNIPFFCKWF